MSQPSRQIKTAAPTPKSGFNPVRYFRNRATFSKLRRSLRAHHFKSSPAVSAGTVYSSNNAVGGAGISLARGYDDTQKISISDSADGDKTIYVKHPTVRSKALSFIKSLPVYVAIGQLPGVVLAISSNYPKSSTAKAISTVLSGFSSSIFGKVDILSLLATGAIFGAALAIAGALVCKVRSISTPSHNRELYDFVRGGDERALSALVQHLEERGFPPGIIESETRNGQA